MCCSSVLTGGGTNIEFALHCLHEVQGNIMVSVFIKLRVSFIDVCLIQLLFNCQASLDLLLMRGDFRTSWHPLNDYHYTGTNSLLHIQIHKAFIKLTSITVIGRVRPLDSARDESLQESPG